MNPGNGTETIGWGCKIRCVDRVAIKWIPATGLKHCKRLARCDKLSWSQSNESRQRDWNLVKSCWALELFSVAIKWIPATGLKLDRWVCLAHLALRRNQMNPGNGTETICRENGWNVAGVRGRNQMNPGNGTETSQFWGSASGSDFVSQSNESRQRDWNINYVHDEIDIEVSRNQMNPGNGTETFLYFSSLGRTCFW